MLKKVLFFSFLLSVVYVSVFAQKEHNKKDRFNNSTDNTTEKDSVSNNYKYTPPAVVKPARDFVMLMATYNNWVSKPDTVKTKAFNYGFQAYLCYDFPIKKTKFSFAAGLGANVSVTYLDQEQLILSDTATLNPQAKFVPDSSHFSRYKFVTTYLTAPFELRYFSNINNRNKGFKAALGLQVGTLIGAHTKAVESIQGNNVKLKVDTRRFISPWSFAASLRVGWGNFSAFGSYNLTTVFKENEGPAITPMSVGFCLTGL